MSRLYKELLEADPTATKEEILEAMAPVYGPGRTKQSFKDSTDINKILDRARQGKAVTHLSRYQPEYGDFSDMPDLLQANERLQRANEIFEALPGETKREFNQDPAAFFTWVGDPKNQSDLESKLKEIAKHGDSVNVNRGAGARGAMASVNEMEGDTPSETITPDTGDSAPSDGANG
jgi:hypothetical protein